MQFAHSSVSDACILRCVSSAAAEVMHSTSYNLHATHLVTVTPPNLCQAYRSAVSLAFSADPHISGLPGGVAVVQTVQGFACPASMDACKSAEHAVSMHAPSPLTMLAGAAQVHHVGAVQCEGGLEEA